MRIVYISHCRLLCSLNTKVLPDENAQDVLAGRDLAGGGGPKAESVLPLKFVFQAGLLHIGHFFALCIVSLNVITMR